MGLRILFAVHDWGLGHATRTLILIRALREAGHQITVISAGRALRLLRDELGAGCELIELRDIPKPLSRYPPLFYLKMSLSMPAVLRTYAREHRYVEQLCRERRFDRIVSDSRFGVVSERVPSYYLFHSLRQIIPGRPGGLEHLVELGQKRLLRRGRKVLVPDEAENGLAGELCHDVRGNWGDALEYIGILSSVTKAEIAEDIDTFISISGAEPQRTIFERIVLAQVWDLPGRIVVTRGRPDLPAEAQEHGTITVHNYLNRQQQQEMMNRARMVVTRSGYTTLMELAELGKRALFIPTRGQSEQEYLAAYHKSRGHVYAVTQSELDLRRDLAIAEGYGGLPPVSPTSHSVERFIAAIEC